MIPVYTGEFSVDQQNLRQNTSTGIANLISTSMTRRDAGRNFIVTSDKLIISKFIMTLDIISKSKMTLDIISKSKMTLDIISKSKMTLDIISKSKMTLDIISDFMALDIRDSTMTMDITITFKITQDIIRELLDYRFHQ